MKGTHAILNKHVLPVHALVDMKGKIMADYTCRQADMVLHIKDKEGNAAANTVFKVRQTEQEFLFGCGAFDAMMAANEKKSVPYETGYIIE